MTNLAAYEQNLPLRLAELRQGDRAYELNGDAITETLPYESFDAESTNTPRVLDVGCGLGFLSLKLAMWPGATVVGIDPSAAAIALAQDEHAATSNLSFVVSSAEDFPAQMRELGYAPFDRAVLNMVLHSVDDDGCKRMLTGIHESLVPYGPITVVTPGQDWLIQKLVEQAQAQGMQREEGLPWIAHQISQDAVTLAYGIHGQDSYPQAIEVFNRTLSDYSRLFLDTGFGVDVEVIMQSGEPPTEKLRLGYWEFDDHLNGYNLKHRKRHVLMTQALPG